MEGLSVRVCTHDASPHCCNVHGNAHCAHHSSIHVAQSQHATPTWHAQAKRAQGARGGDACTDRMECRHAELAQSGRQHRALGRRRRGNWRANVWRSVVGAHIRRVVVVLNPAYDSLSSHLLAFTPELITFGENPCPCLDLYASRPRRRTSTEKINASFATLGSVFSPGDTTVGSVAVRSVARTLVDRCVSPASWIKMKRCTDALSTVQPRPRPRWRKVVLKTSQLGTRR